MTDTEAASDRTAVTPVISHWIEGRPVEVLPEHTGPVYDPATGQVVARVPRGGADEVDRAVAAAAEATPAWRDMPLIARSQISSPQGAGRVVRDLAEVEAAGRRQQDHAPAGRQRERREALFIDA